MGFNPVEIFTKPAEKVSIATGLPSLPVIDPFEVLKDPGAAGQGAIDLLRDPLSALQGLPGIDGTEPSQDLGALETARQDQTKEIKTKALLVKRQKEADRQSTILTGSQNLASDDTAGIATRSLLG